MRLTISSRGAAATCVLREAVEPSPGTGRQRTAAGLAAARARGRLGGRRPKLTAKQISIGRALYDSRQHTVAEICEQLGCSSATFYRRVKLASAPTTPQP